MRPAFQPGPPSPGRSVYLLRDEAQRPLTEVRRILHRDHSTILHGLNKVQESYYADQDLRREIDEIRSRLGRS